MENIKFDSNKYLVENSKSFKDYVLLIRANLLIFIGVFLLVAAAFFIYAITAKNIYRSTVTLKIDTQKKNILDSNIFPQMSNSNDRFIANEIEIIMNYDSRERYAKALVDSFNISHNKAILALLKDEKESGEHKNQKEIADLLSGVIIADQISGLDMIEISAESPSPFEAALFANTCAAEYMKLNLETNRGQLTDIRKFLEGQAKIKASELNVAEEGLKNYQQQGGIIALDAQSNVLINQLANLDAQRDAAKVDLLTSNEILKQYKREINEQDPQLADYLESQTSQSYIDALQKQITALQMNKDMALSNKNPNVDVTDKINDYDKKINELKEKLNSAITDIKAGAYSSSPDQIRDLTQKLIEEKVNNNALVIKNNELQNLISNYEQNFSKMPRKAIEFAQYQRKRESMQQLYLLVEHKYQEALINELSQPGNALIIGKGQLPGAPSKPDRKMIILAGIVCGLGVAFGFILIKDYFDDTIKSPEDIEMNNVKFLAWVPHLKNAGEEYFRSHELGSSGETDSILKASFKSIRARIQFTNVNQDKNFKTILITSPTAEEGKTMIAVNLASSFIRANQKVLLVDCDLVKPRIHTLMGIKRSPGLTDYLAREVSLESITNKCFVNDLDYITAGTEKNNTDQILGSYQMKDFLQTVKQLYDIIIIDSAPIVPIIDSQILARLIDTTILVISARKTEAQLMNDALKLIKNDGLPFLGVVFNNFRYKDGHHYYHKYYYNYSSNGNGKLDKIKV